jgi:beta-glucosidase
VVSVLLSGRPRWVNPELNASTAFVAAWLPGTEGGGVADVLLRTNAGEVHHDFVGRLSFSWPMDPAQTPLNRNDADYRPLFPYGFGLSSTAADTLSGTLPEADPTQVTGRAVRRLPE